MATAQGDAALVGQFGDIVRVDAKGAELAVKGYWSAKT
jgi:hypothetical protein